MVHACAAAAASGARRGPTAARGVTTTGQPASRTTEYMPPRAGLPGIHGETAHRMAAVVATLGREAFKLDLGTVGTPAVRVAALAAAATLAVGGALRAQARELVDVATFTRLSLSCR